MKKNWVVIVILLGVGGIILAGTSWDPFAEPGTTRPAEVVEIEAVEAKSAAIPDNLGMDKGQYRYLTQWVSPEGEKEVLVFDCWGNHSAVTCSVNWGGILEAKVSLSDLSPPSEWDRYEPTPVAPTPKATPTPEPTTAEASSASGLTDEEIETKAAEARGILVSVAAALFSAVAVFRWILPALGGLLGRGRRKRRR